MKSPAVTSHGPFFSIWRVLGPSVCKRTEIRFKLSTISVTSSFTPGMVLNSCNTPSIRMFVAATPGSEESRIRRRELPSVVPKPRSSGSTTNLPYVGSKITLSRFGFSISIIRVAPPLLVPPYLVKGVIWSRAQQSGALQSSDQYHRVAASQSLYLPNFRGPETTIWEPCGCLLHEAVSCSPCSESRSEP